MIHDRDQPFGGQQGLDQLRRQIVLPCPCQLVAQPAPHPIGNALLGTQGGFDQNWQPHHPAGFSLLPPAGDREGQARLASAAVAAEQQHVAARRRQQGLQILRPQEPWALRGRRPRRGEAHIQRHMHLARLHGGQAQKGPSQPGVVPFHPGLELLGGVVALGGCGAVGSLSRFWRWVGCQGSDLLAEHLPTAAAILLITAIHWHAVVAHSPAKGRQRRLGFRLALDSIASIRDKSQIEGMERTASLHGCLELQLRNRPAPMLGPPGSVSLSKNQDVVVAGSHIPLAGLHQWI